jgi:hypothetical protein
MQISGYGAHLRSWKWFTWGSEKLVVIVISVARVITYFIFFYFMHIRINISLNIFEIKCNFLDTIHVQDHENNFISKAKSCVARFYIIIMHIKETYSVSFEISYPLIFYGDQLIWTIKIRTTVKT